MNYKELTSDIIEQICEMTKLRMSWKQIADALGVTSATMRDWRKKGEDPSNPECYAMMQGVSKARADMVRSYASLVYEGILNGDKVTTTETVLDADGMLKGTKITERESSPNVQEAKKILALEDPANWADVHNIKVDWRANIQGIGLDPQMIAELYFKFLSDNGASLPIPQKEIPTLT